MWLLAAVGLSRWKSPAAVLSVGMHWKGRRDMEELEDEDSGREGTVDDD